MSYCAGQVFGVRRTLYGTGRPVVVGGVVTRVDGSSVTLTGGPSCFPEEWCGQTLPSMTVTFPAGPLPVYGDVVSVFGVTGVGTMVPTFFEVTGHCDPDTGDC